MALAQREAVREFETKAVTAIADAGGGEVGTVAIGQHARDERVIDQDQQAQRRIRLRLVLGPAGDPVAADFVQKAAQRAAPLSARGLMAGPPARARQVPRQSG